MNPRINYILILIAGLLIGVCVYMATVLIGNFLIPLPGDILLWNPASIRASRHLFEFRHLVFPSLGHSLGVGVAAGFIYHWGGKVQRVGNFIPSMVIFWAINWMITMVFLINWVVTWS